jgi:hypothetical protein
MDSHLLYPTLLQVLQISLLSRNFPFKAKEFILWYERENIEYVQDLKRRGLFTYTIRHIFNEVK